MTPQEKGRLAALITAMSAYYGARLADDVVRLQVNDLDDLPFHQVEAAYGAIRRDPKTRQMPLPAAVRAVIHPQLSTENQATIAANRVVECIAKFGPYRGAEARLYMGDIAWQVVQAEGGWMSVCEQVTNDNLGMFKAQWRRLAESLLAGGRLATPDRERLTNSETTKRLVGFFPEMPKGDDPKGGPR